MHTGTLVSSGIHYNARPVDEALKLVAFHKVKSVQLVYDDHHKIRE